MFDTIIVTIEKYNIALLEQLRLKYFIHIQHLSDFEYLLMRRKIIIGIMQYVSCHIGILLICWCLYGLCITDKYKHKIYFVWIVRDTTFTILVFVLLLLRFFHLRYEFLENFGWIEPNHGDYSNGTDKFNNMPFRVYSWNIYREFIRFISINLIYDAIDVNIKQQWLKYITCQYMFGTSKYDRSWFQLNNLFDSDQDNIITSIFVSHST